jgi:hypothetical protein
VGRWRRRLRKDDDIVGLGTVWVNGIVDSRMMTLLQAREQRRWPGDGACVVDGITDFGQGRW